MTKMHIGFLTPEYPHAELSRSGGLGTSIKNLANGLLLKDVEVTIFVIAQNFSGVITDNGIRIISIAKKNHIAFNWYLERKRIQRIINKHIDLDKISLIEAPDWTGVSAFMKFNVPLLIRLNGSDGYFSHLERRQQKKKNRFLEQKALSSADAIVTVSTFTGAVTKKIFNLKHKISTIHNSIDVNVFQALKVKENKGQILYFGTIIRKKGVLDLAKIFNIVNEKNPDVSLLLIGKDSNDVFENKSTISLFYNELTDKAKMRVNHLPEVPYEEIKTKIAEAEIVVLPSFAEAFPMTWLETLAMKKALVSSNVGWAKELMVNGKTGYTVDPKNHELFASKLLELSANKELRKRFGEEGRKHVTKNFSVEIVTQQNIELYKSVISS